MAIDKADKERIEQLRKRRMRLAEEKEREVKRTSHGAEVVAKLNSALGSRLTLDDFDVTAKLPVEFVRQPSFADCMGLVAAHIAEQRIREILACCDAAVGPLSGVIGLDEYEYVGSTRFDSVRFGALLDAAKALHDSVLFCPDDPTGVILIDHYKVSGMPRDVGFSVVIQGELLEAKLAQCFENVVRIRQTAR